MKVKLYNSEKFERGAAWYAVFSSVVVAVLLLSLFNDNVVGAILLFFLLGGYFYYTISSSQSVDAEITSTGLVLGSKNYPWNVLTGYVLEVDRKTQIIKNIVFLFPRVHVIHSFDDEKENIKSFLLVLNDYLPMMVDYEQTFLQKIIRKIKL